MALAHTAARLLMGTTYAVLGADAFRQPGGRVDMAGDTLKAIRDIVPLPEDDELLVRANGAVQAVAGTLLGLGILPRFSAVALVGSMVPTTTAGHAFWKIDDPAGRQANRTQFLKNAAMIGGLLYVAADRRGAGG